MAIGTGPLLCDKCGTEIAYSSRECAGCGRDIGFPNVRAADQPVEIAALQDRVRYAQRRAAERNCANELETFGTAASESKAVIARPMSVLDSMVSNKQSAMQTYHKMVRIGARLPENNAWDANRDRIEGTVHPFGVYEHIQYAALSLDGRGVHWYGNCSVTLKEGMIADRASVFEENPFIFCDKHPIPSTGSLPPGFRATWPRRGELAMAKLHPRIQPGMTGLDFPAILVEQGASSAQSDFIEVNIYGAIIAKAIEHVILEKPTRRADRVIWKRIQRDLESLGVHVEEV